MESIFTYKPTSSELLEIAGKSNISESEYFFDRAGDFLLLDLALLFELRSNKSEASKYWGKIPELKLQYQLGFDDQLKTSGE